jgi:hypothetical protein
MILAMVRRGPDAPGAMTVNGTGYRAGQVCHPAGGKT